MKKILLIEPDKEQAELFAAWLQEENYRVNSAENHEQVSDLLSREKFDLLIMDIDDPKISDSLLELCRELKKDTISLPPPITVLTYKKDAKKIAAAISAGADRFVFKPFETDSFLKRIETIFKEMELKKQGKKVLDLNYLNFLIHLTRETGREGFFLLTPVIFNNLIIEETKGILGDPVITVMINRVRELTEDSFAFMKKFKLQDGKLVMDDVDTASRGVPANLLATGFQNFVYAFLSLVQVLTSDILMERDKL